MRPLVFLYLLFATTMIFPQASATPIDVDAVASARKKAKRKRKSRKTKAKRTIKRKSRVREPVDVPVDVGIGPSFLQLSGPVQDQQNWHYGVKLSLAAVIDKALIESQKHRVPKKYRKHVKKVGEVRFRPGPIALVPDALFISPPTDSKSGLYGANWRVVSVGASLIRRPTLSLSTGLNLTYAYLTESDTLPATHFLRPGIDLAARFELPLSRRWLISFGWTSLFCPPQKLGGALTEMGNLNESIWHIGQAFAQLHYRFPYRVRL